VNEDSAHKAEIPQQGHRPHLVLTNIIYCLPPFPYPSFLQFSITVSVSVSATRDRSDASLSHSRSLLHSSVCQARCKVTDMATSSHRLPPPSDLLGQSGLPTAMAGQHIEGPVTRMAEQRALATATSPITSESSTSSVEQRWTRKRAASIAINEANQPRIEDLSLDTPRTLGHSATDIAKDTCLCTPAPKIPRPRNGRHPYFFLSTLSF
jgi:hypothetical protein